MHTNKEEFEQKVDHIHSLFYKNIKDQFPDLRENDLRLLSLIRANMSSKDIAILLSINPKSVDMARYRLRKKMNLEKEVNLMEFLLKF
jgi:DNA-binding CsgD family transcriptional regulator